MKSSGWIVTVAAVIAAAMVLGFSAPTSAPDGDHPNTEKAMKEGNKGGLLKKILGGEASQKEKERLLELYIAMWPEKAPKGDPEQYKVRKAATIAAAPAVVAGEKDGLPRLKKATNCKACHNQHKG